MLIKIFKEINSGKCENCGEVHDNVRNYIILKDREKIKKIICDDCFNSKTNSKIKIGLLEKTSLTLTTKEKENKCNCCLQTNQENGYFLIVKDENYTSVVNICKSCFSKNRFLEIEIDSSNFNFPQVFEA